MRMRISRGVTSTSSSSSMNSSACSSVTPADLARGEVTLVNFWASWCPPCVHEMPSMSRLNDDYREQPFTILAINLGERIEDIQNFLQQHPVNFPVLLDPQQQLPRQWKVFAFPTSYIIDKQGRIRYSVAGGIDWTSDEAKRAIQGLLDQAQ